MRVTWIKEKIVDLLLCFFSLGFIFLIFKKSYMIENIDYINLMIIFFLGAVIFYFYNSLNKNHKLNFLIGLVVLLIITILLFRVVLDDFLLERIIFKVRKINESVGKGERTYYEDYKYILTFIGPILVISILTLIRCSLIYIIIYINLSLMMFLYYIGYSDVLRNVIIQFIIINLCVLGVDGFRTNIRVLKGKNINTSVNRIGVALNITIFSLIIALIVNLMPLQKKGKYQNEITNKMNKVLRGIEVDEEGVNEEIYGLSYSGYSNGLKKLGGPIKISDEEVLDIESEVGGLYLRGSVKDIYLGDKWGISFKTLRSIDESKFSSQNNYSNHNGILNKRSLKIYPKNNENNTLFSPLYYLGGDLPKNTYHISRYDIFYNKNKNIKEYSFDYYEEEKIKSNIKNAANSMSSNDLNMEYLDIANLPSSVINLTKEITKESNSNYEKVEKIKNYLEKNYPYSLEVSNVPEGVDFTEYFLFQEKKGYCVYFATALTMMSRVVGVPARYVEGFKMPYTSLGGNKFKVTNEDAHGWVEVLLDPRGELWTTMDASPTLREVREKEGVKKPEQINKDDKENIGNKEGKNLGSEEKQEKNKEEEIEKVEKKRNINYKLISIVLLIVILFYVSLKSFITLYKIRLLKIKGSGKNLYKYAEKRMKTIGVVRKSYETDIEFVNSINDKVLREELMKMLIICHKEIYGGVTSNIKGEDFIKFIESYIRSNMKFLRYIVYKYLI